MLKRCVIFVLSGVLLLFIVAGLRVGEEEVLAEEKIPQLAKVAQKLVVEPITVEQDTGCEDEGERVGAFVDARLVGRLAKGMRAIVDKRDRGSWAYCGELLTEEQQIKLSTKIAYSFVLSMNTVGLEVSPWGVMATVYNESGFDACALGLFPRKWGYEKGILVKKKETRSHTLEEVLAFKADKRVIKRYKATGIDLGFCQILSRFYLGQSTDMLSMEHGPRICVLEMLNRANKNKTIAPWLYWKGSKTTWYQKRIRRWAKMMGATPKELGKI